jgi:hypothetical protein
MHMPQNVERRLFWGRISAATLEQAAGWGNIAEPRNARQARQLRQVKTRVGNKPQVSSLFFEMRPPSRLRQVKTRVGNKPQVSSLFFEMRPPSRHLDTLRINHSHTFGKKGLTS